MKKIKTAKIKRINKKAIANKSGQKENRIKNCKKRNRAKNKLTNN
jgi:hypothetical protein